MSEYTRDGCDVLGPRGFHVECDSQADAVVLLERLTSLTQQNAGLAEGRQSGYRCALCETVHVDPIPSIYAQRGMCAVCGQHALKCDDLVAALRKICVAAQRPARECPLSQVIRIAKDAICKALTPSHPHAGSKPNICPDIYRSNPKCGVCGDTPSAGDGAWRVNADQHGNYWEHRCRDAHPQTGYWRVPPHAGRGSE